MKIGKSILEYNVDTNDHPYVELFLLQETGQVLYNLTLQTANTTSAVMAEKEAFITLFNKAREELGSLFKSVTTDGSISIRAFMKKDTSGVKHGLDIWHLAKNLSKNIKAKCRNKVIHILRSL